MDEEAEEEEVGCEMGGFPRIRRSSFTGWEGLGRALNWKRGRGATLSTALSSLSLRLLIACARS